MWYILFGAPRTSYLLEPYNLVRGRTLHDRNSTEFQFLENRSGNFPITIYWSDHKRKQIRYQMNYTCLYNQENLTFLKLRHLLLQNVVHFIWGTSYIVFTGAIQPCAWKNFPSIYPPKFHRIPVFRKTRSENFPITIYWSDHKRKQIRYQMNYTCLYNQEKLTFF